MSSAPAEIAGGLWRWTTRHPDWHPGAFGASVGSYALVAGAELLLIDPLLPAEPDAVLERLDALAAGRRVSALITIGYHVRSAEQLARRYDGLIQGPPNAATRLADPDRLTVLEPGQDGPAGVRAFHIGRPRRGERPLWLPSHAAIAFGDAVVATPDGELRVWTQRRLTDRSRRWWHDVFAPTLAPVAGLPAQRILVTHGDPVLHDGAAELGQALAAEPWYHRG